ncbi:MAG: hypothetical protein HKN42_15175 [Granulosicoccus sp.]|nr:hypothetical protein [Granulosicoccus sp.]
MKHLKQIIIGTVAVATVAAGATVYAQRGEGHGQERMIERVSSRLELDDNQNAALSAFAAELTDMRDLMRGNGTSMREEFKALIEAETFDQTRALSMINERVAVLQANAPELVVAAGTFFDGLSPEQKSQVRALAERGGHRHHDRWNH